MGCCFPSRTESIDEELARIESGQIKMEAIIPGVNTPTVPLKSHGSSKSAVPATMATDSERLKTIDDDYEEVDTDEEDGPANEEDPIEQFNSEVPITDQTPMPSGEEIDMTKDMALKMFQAQYGPKKKL